MKQISKLVQGNSSYGNIQTVTVTHNLNNLNPYVSIKEETTNSFILTHISYTLNNLSISGLRTGTRYIVTIIG
jgi:hypothetical protein